jgi:hypothetical protein
MAWCCVHHYVCVLVCGRVVGRVRVRVCAAQLAEVFWVEGLGPSKELWMAETDLAAGSAADVDGVDDAHHGPAAAGAAGTHVRNTFADQVGAREGQQQQPLALLRCSVLRLLLMRG